VAKYCALCGKRLGFLDGRIVVSDGLVCASCWSNAGFDMSMRTMSAAINKTIKQLRDLIEIEALKREAEKKGLRQEIKTAEETAVSVTSKKSNSQETSASKKKTDKKKRGTSSTETRSGKDETDLPKPIDVVIFVSKEDQVSFHCEGHPIINFDDLINGKELIIGDGYIRNESDLALPEVRISCEFDPPIIDSGMIYYEAGTFVSGANGKFGIDDPPINLEEYAKIKRIRNGTVKLTLFLGEQQMQTAQCSLQVKPAPEEKLKALMSAIAYEEEKNSPGPVNVFLYARENGEYDLDVMRNPQLLYSMYSNGKEQLIGDIYISNESNKILKNVRFQADFTSDILASVDVHLGSVPAGKNISFEVDDPAIDIEKLVRLTEIEACTATYRILSNGKVLAESKGKITICPYNQWNAALILLPAYMTPNHPNVINVLQNASKWMLVNGMNPSLEGYQSDSKRVEEMIRGVYNAVKEANIIYSNPPASFFGPQRIRLCETVFEQKFATCMDITILFASCLESFGLHPVLITAPGHIFAGVWLNKEGRLSEAIISDAEMIKQFIDEGKLVAIECTAMTVGNDISYEEAKKIAVDEIAQISKHHIHDHECIDVQLARAIGVRPLPMRTHVVSVVNAPAAPAAVAQTTPETVSKVETKAEQAETQTKKVITKKKYQKEDYLHYTEDLSQINSENFYDKLSKRIMKEAIVEIASIEGPISQSGLIKILIGRTGLGRSSKQMVEYLDKMIASSGVKITRQSGERYLWKQGLDPTEYHTYRFAEQRSLDGISKYEMKNAVCWLIQEHGPMTQADICKKLISLFGYSRSSKKIEEASILAIKSARELKAIQKNSDDMYELV